MSVFKAVKGSDLISKALLILEYKGDQELVHNLVVDIDIHKTTLTINGNLPSPLTKTSNDNWDSLLDLCGYSFLKDKPIRSMKINLLSNAAANFDINLLCEVD